MKTREEIGREIRITSYAMNKLPKLSKEHSDYEDNLEALEFLRKKIQYLNKKLEEIEK